MFHALEMPQFSKIQTFIQYELAVGKLLSRVDLGRSVEYFIHGRVS